MTTDPTSGDRVARLEAVRQRRTETRPAVPDDTAEPLPATTATGRPSRRRHAAAGGRILAGGLSAAAGLGLMGAMAHAASPAADSSPTAVSTPTAAVVVIRRPAVATGVAAPAAPPVTATVAAAVATSRGS